MAAPPAVGTPVISSLQKRIESLETSSWIMSCDVAVVVATAMPESCSPKRTTTRTTTYDGDDDDDDDTRCHPDPDADADDSTIVATAPPTPPLPEGVRRARRHAQMSRCYSSKWKFVRPPPSSPSSSSVVNHYYSLGLEERRVILGAHAISQLCKSCLFENRNYVTTPMPTNDGAASRADPTNSRYYLIVVQYVESVNVKKLGYELRGLRPPGPDRFDAAYFSDMRLAPEDASSYLTGYGRNGVSPFGIRDGTIPIIVCASILRIRPKFIWMGGGHEDWKLGVAVCEFLRATNALVLDVSEPRAGIL